MGTNWIKLLSRILCSVYSVVLNSSTCVRGIYKNQIRGCFNAFRRFGGRKVGDFSWHECFFFKEAAPIACSWVPVLLCYSDLRPEMFHKHLQGLANVTQGEIAISFLANQDSFFLANADVFQGWPQPLSSPNVLKVNVSLPEEKPLLRGMVKVDFI